MVNQKVTLDQKWYRREGRENRAIKTDRNARFQPAPDHADQARITDSMFDKSENPIVIEAPKEVIQIRL